MKRLTLTFGLLALAAVLAACSGASAAPREQSTPPAGTTGGATVAVVAKDIKFVTPAVTVKAGAGVRDRLRQPGRRPAQHRDLGCERRQGLQGRHRVELEGHLPGPGPGRRHVHLHLRGPSRHEGHDHGPVIGPSSAAIEASGMAGGFGDFSASSSRRS